MATKKKTKTKKKEPTNRSKAQPKTRPLATDNILSIAATRARKKLDKGTICTYVRM